MNSESPSHTQASALAQQRAREAIALFEGAKGLAALASGAGLLSLLHNDIRHLALELIGHFGLDPHQHFPELLLHYVDLVNGTPVRTLMLLILAYVAIRMAEAYGLWRDRAWGEWLGALSGSLYIPFELHHLWFRPGWINLAVVLINIGTVVFLVWQLWQRRGGAAVRS